MQNALHLSLVLLFSAARLCSSVSSFIHNLQAMIKYNCFQYLPVEKDFEILFIFSRYERIEAE